MRFYNLVDVESGELIAYAAVERAGAIAHLRDLFGRDAAAIGLLLDMLLPRLRRAGAEAAWFSVLGPPWLESLLKKRGFVAREDRCVVVDWRSSSAGGPSDLLDPARWYLTEADEDA
jgi:hypothetical protein